MNTKIKEGDLVYFYGISDQELPAYIPQIYNARVVRPSPLNHPDILDLQLLDDNDEMVGFAKAHRKCCEKVDKELPECIFWGKITPKVPQLLQVTYVEPKDTAGWVKCKIIEQTVESID